MDSCRFVLRLARDWAKLLFPFIQSFFMTSTELRIRMLAMQSQLSLFTHDVEAGKRPKPVASPAFRQLWVVLSKIWPSWDRWMKTYRPSTIINWHRTGFRFVWRSKSRRMGRPPISRKTIALIKRLHRENPLLSPEKLHEKMLQLGILDAPAPNTIAKYCPATRKPPSQKQLQSWRTFLKNHAFQAWGMDFFTVPTLFFDVLHVLIIIHHGSRRIVHVAVTKHPTVAWARQQLRNATPFGVGPKYLFHDNDPVFTAKALQDLLTASGIVSKRTSYESPWQNPYAERVIGTLRRELLNHMIPLNESHLRCLLNEYVQEYYNLHRTHQGLGGQTPIPSPEYLPTVVAETQLSAKPVLSGLYHTYKKVA